MIPTFDENTGYLPPGVHIASWAEVVEAFSWNSHRARLLRGLEAALQNLRDAGCRYALLDGSFVSTKQLPDDYDGAWDIHGVNPDKLDCVLLDFSNRRAAMKAKFGGELFPASAQAEPGVLYRDFFQTDRSGVSKGIVQIDLGSLP